MELFHVDDTVAVLLPRDLFAAGPPVVSASLFLGLDIAPVGACFFRSQPSNGLACFLLVVETGVLL